MENRLIPSTAKEVGEAISNIVDVNEGAFAGASAEYDWCAEIDGVRHFLRENLINPLPRKIENEFEYEGTIRVIEHEFPALVAYIKSLSFTEGSLGLFLQQQLRGANA